MVQTSASGSDDVIAYGSSFTSGEAGIVIINKGSSSETALVEFEDFKPGIRYYYHTLTGGDDNGDFSRKVFLNGYGTDEEGGGPDDYETVKAFASETEGGIKVSLPPLSVVYLMVERDPTTSYFSPGIIDNSKAIPGIVFYPNPADDRITIENHESDITAVEIVDITGKRILYRHLESPRKKITLDLKAFPGVYLLKIISDNHTHSSRLVVY
jgi:hypothetical protein